LPQPEGPTKAMNSPAWIFRSMAARMRLSPKDFSIASKCSAGDAETALIGSLFSCTQISPRVENLLHRLNFQIVEPIGPQELAFDRINPELVHHRAQTALATQFFLALAANER